jgi:hypothetical protein
MSAYNPEGIGTEAYLTRIISAICKQSGGTVRIKGELVDAVGESTVFTTEWDSSKQELVLTAPIGTHVRVYRVVPENQRVKEVIAADPIRKQVPEEPNLFAPKGSTLDDNKLTELERQLTKRRVASMISEDLKKRQRQPEA